jgi:hypothetical protein
MKNKPASTPLLTATDADDTGLDIERLESEAQTHDCCGDDIEEAMPVVPSGNATQRETRARRLLLAGQTWGGSSYLMLGQRI